MRYSGQLLLAVYLFDNNFRYTKGPAFFYISNYGDMLTQVKETTSKPKYPHVTYVWFKDRKGVLDLLKKFRIGILTSANDIAR